MPAETNAYSCWNGMVEDFASWSSPDKMLVGRTAEASIKERRLARVSSVAELRVLARRRVPRAVFDYVDGGVEGEVSLRGQAGVTRVLQLLHEEVTRTLQLLGVPDLHRLRSGSVHLPSAGTEACS